MRGVSVRREALTLPTWRAAVAWELATAMELTRVRDSRDD